MFDITQDDQEYPNLSWKFIILMLIPVVCACHAAQPDSQDSSSPAVAIESQQLAVSGSASSREPNNALRRSLKSGMAYADFRKVVLGQSWEPVVNPQCKTNVVGADHQALCADHPDMAACRLCEQVPELNACSSDGYCLMEFRHAGSGEALEATSYGMIEDWNVSGEDSRLQVSRWTFTEPSGVSNKREPMNKDAEVNELKSFVDDGATILATQRGDLNGDGVQDVVLVLDHPESGGDQLGEGAHRSLLLLIRDDAGQLSKAGQNDAIVPCAECGGMAGDPFGYVRVEQGAFTVLVEGGSRERWSDEYAFIYSAEARGWLLDKAIHGVTDTITGEAEQTELTRKNFGVIGFEEFDPSKLPSVEGA